MRKRVGPRFATIVDFCSDDLKKRVMQENSEFNDRSYTRIVQRNFSAEDERSKISGSDSNTKVVLHLRWTRFEA